MAVQRGFQFLARTEVTRLQHLRDAPTETFDPAICLGVTLVDQVSPCLKSRTVHVTHSLPMPSHSAAFQLLSNQHIVVGVFSVAIY